MGFPILTLQSLMEYDDTLFNGIQLPSGADMETLLDTICMEYGQMQLLYPDWDTMRRAIKSWFRRKAVTFEHLWTDYIASYNPLYNKDAYYEETRTPNLTETRTPNLTETRTPDLTETRTPNLTETRTPDLQTDVDHGLVTTESGQRDQQLQGFNSSSFANVSRELPGAALTNSGTDTTTETGTDTTTQTGTDTTTQTGTDTTTKTGTETTEHTGNETIKRREYGNIGVTTATQMLRDDVDFWSGFSWYDIVAKEFAVDFCVMIY